MDDPAWPNYGGRGILLSPNWTKFSNFIQDMGKRPSQIHSIDRIDNNGIYSKENCRWATPIEQNRNKRNNNYIEVNGDKKLVVEWAEIYGVCSKIINQRIQRGWSQQMAATISSKNRMCASINGVTKEIKSWCDEYNINYSTVRTRINRGWSVEDALTTPVNQRNKRT
jgi:hypothetical protein